MRLNILRDLTPFAPETQTVVCEPGDWLYVDEAGQLVKREMDEAKIEQASQLIYESWSDLPGYKPWVVGGNSLKQDEARTIAKAILNCWKEKENG